MWPLQYDNFHHDIKSNLSSEKYKVSTSKHKDNSKYSCLGNKAFNRGLEKAIADYKSISSNKTPSHNSRF